MLAVLDGRKEGPCRCNRGRLAWRGHKKLVSVIYMGQEVLSPLPGEQQRRKHPGGRPAGAPNKVGYNIRQMILDAIDSLGGENYFIALAVTQPQAFAALVGRVLPTIVVVDPDADLGKVREIRRTVTVLPAKK